MEKQNNFQPDWLDRPVLKAFPGFTREKFIVTVIIILAILSRFIMLGERVMSHDEVNHVVPSYSLYKGMGYAHDPVTHGPFQFHMVALSYFILGDNDFSSRVPAALFSVAAIIFVLFAFRRYLGRIGALVGGFLFLISPFLLYYGRYTRNEGFIELFAVVTFYGLLRYFEERDHFSLYLLAIVTALQFATKEVAYIYTAQLLLFCGVLFLFDLWELLCPLKKIRSKCLFLFLGALVLIAAGAGLLIFAFRSEPVNSLFAILGAVVCGTGLIMAVASIVIILIKLGWAQFRTLPTFNLIVFIGALILPLLTAFPVKLIGWDPLDYSSNGMLRTGIVLGILTVISFLVGCWWNREIYLKSAVIFYLIFVTLYTTLFSNGQGFFTGIIGSLGYWLSQQGVQRGGQPFYYYGLILIPLYEFTALAGTILAVYFASKYHLFFQKPSSCLSQKKITKSEMRMEDTSEIYEESKEIPNSEEPKYIDNVFTSDSENINPNIYRITPEDPEFESGSDTIKIGNNGKIPTLLLFLFWSITALLAYSVAGEKMPWLSVHIAIPLALSAAWGIGYLLETSPWKKIFSWNGFIGIAVLITGLFALNGVVSTTNAAIKPFSGKELVQLKATNQFIFSAAVLIVTVFVLFRVWRKWSANSILKTFTLFVLFVLSGLQARTAYTASFINYDYANELLVYAHGAPGPKTALKQIEEVAARTGQGKAIKVAYDGDARYPYWWYFRDYNARFDFGEENPTRELRNYDIIIANTSKEGRLEPIVRNGYYRYEYVRLWWPNQDYWNLTIDRILNAVSNPGMRSALFDIWLNRDYTSYAQVTGKTTLTPETWEPSARMVVYMKKDLLQKMWSLGDVSNLVQTQDESADTFEDEKFTEINPVLSIGGQGSGEGQFEAPRGVAVSDSGRVYVLDSDNNRVQYFSETGEYLGMWNASEQGGFSQPWGIDVGPDGSVYVADTWNHRMLKFDPDGNFLTEWYANDPTDPTKTFYGPRSVAVDSTGRVFVSDTGNKRIMVYSQNGEYIGKFGTAGMGTGELDEPVGIAIYNDERLAVADTWNQRVQVFDIKGDDPSTYTVVASFEVQAWYSQSLDNKPYIAFSKDGDIMITDPEGYLIWEYSMDGNLIRSWNGGGGNIDAVSMPSGITVDSDGSVWIVNTNADQVNKFILPVE
ncbi:MAG: glycosyltransferase family 39 protein [Flexilinea sp.]